MGVFAFGLMTVVAIYLLLWLATSDSTQPIERKICLTAAAIVGVCVGLVLSSL